MVLWCKMHFLPYGPPLGVPYAACRRPFYQWISETAGDRFTKLSGKTYGGLWDGTSLLLIFEFLLCGSREQGSKKCMFLDLVELQLSGFNISVWDLRQP